MAARLTATLWTIFGVSVDQLRRGTGELVATRSSVLFVGKRALMAAQAE